MRVVHQILCVFTMAILFSPFLQADEKIDKAEKDKLKVKITKDISYVDITHEGEEIRIQRIQNTSNVLSDSFAKTSRPCPPFCINPIYLTDDVKTVGELEILDFLEKKVGKGGGVLIDARMPKWFAKGTIPGSVNIPFTILSAGIENKHTARILKLLGATEKKGKWDFKEAKELALFCNGMWCGQSPRAIKNLIKLGYPETKLFWYRGGMQSWLLAGMTTVKPEE